MTAKKAAEPEFPRELHVDEKVYWLREVFRDVDMIGLQIIQKIEVIRNDHLVTYEKSLGPAWMFPNANPFQFFAGNEYSVGEVMEIADRCRDGKPPENLEEQNREPIGEGWMKQRAEKEALAHHRSVIGPHVRIQRD